MRLHFYLSSSIFFLHFSLKAASVIVFVKTLRWVKLFQASENQKWFRESFKLALKATKEKMTHLIEDSCRWKPLKYFHTLNLFLNVNYSEHCGSLAICLASTSPSPNSSQVRLRQPVTPKGIWWVKKMDRIIFDEEKKKDHSIHVKFCRHTHI